MPDTGAPAVNRFGMVPTFVELTVGEADIKQK